MDAGFARQHLGSQQNLHLSSLYYLHNKLAFIQLSVAFLETQTEVGYTAVAVSVLK